MIYEARDYTTEGAFPFSAASMAGEAAFMLHCHRELEIILSEEGELPVEVNGVRMYLRAGELLLIPPYAAHSILPSGTKSRRIACLLDMSLAGSSPWPGGDVREMETLLSGRKLCSTDWQAETTRRVTAVIETMYAEYKNAAPGWQLAVKAGLNQLLLAVWRELPRAEGGGEVRDLSKITGILGYIARHYTEAISLGECAKDAGFHPSYLSRYFKERMGMTFQEYVKQLRIDRARWLLRNRELSVTEVSYASGFRDIKTFNKLFRAECGMTPTEFRRRECSEG